MASAKSKSRSPRGKISSELKGVIPPNDSTISSLPRTDEAPGTFRSFLKKSAKLGVCVFLIVSFANAWKYHPNGSMMAILLFILLIMTFHGLERGIEIYLKLREEVRNEQK